MRARVNELLTLSRLPHALWTGLHGGREHFDNPGASVISFCARYLGSEFIEVPAELEESIKQCREFSTKREHIEVILTHLEVKAAEAGNACNQLNEKQNKYVFGHFSELVKHSQEVKKLRSALEVNGLLPARLDASSQIYPTFTQAILELNWAITNLNDLLATFNVPPKSKA